MSHAQFVAGMQRAYQVHGVLERDLRIAYQGAVRLECFAEQCAPRDSGCRRRLRLHGDGVDETKQAADAREDGRFPPHAQRAGEERCLPRRLAAVTRDAGAAGLMKIGAVELADAVIRQTGPRTNSVRARFVVNETKCQVQPQPVAAVSIVGDSHVSPPSL